MWWERILLGVCGGIILAGAVTSWRGGMRRQGAVLGALVAWLSYFTMVRL